jgi:hypothetical protein
MVGSLLSVEEYLKLERTSEVRHEYVDGRVYAIAAQDEPRVVVYRRDAWGWRVEVLEGEGELEVVC